MSQSVEAIYENGVLKPRQPVQLSEHQHVRLIIEPATELSREEVIKRLKAMGHLQGQPSRLTGLVAQPLTYEEWQQTLPQLDPPLSQQILEDRR
jgi:predicted DNA-binding antitoxin AbrB/MazE fold protein